jgi:hypothetical protein
MSVSSADLLVSSVKAAAGMEIAIANITGLPDSRYVEATLSSATSRRLEKTETRRLSTGTVKVEYVITIPHVLRTQMTSDSPAEFSAAMISTIAGTSYDQMKDVIIHSLASVQIVGVQVTVTSIGIPTVSQAGQPPVVVDSFAVKKVAFTLLQFLPLAILGFLA